jgi:hypothetical protein
VLYEHTLYIDFRIHIIDTNDAGPLVKACEITGKDSAEEALAALVGDKDGVGLVVIKRGAKVGRCRLTVSKPVLKAPMVSALDTII